MRVSPYVMVEEFKSRMMRDQGGFLKPEDVEYIASTDYGRLTPLLVRFHEGRLTAPAQDVNAIISGLTVAGWCVRDVSLPVTLREPV